MVEKEQKRLEVMRRRQERELAQLISYEMARKEMQEKAEAKVGAAVREPCSELPVWLAPGVSQAAGAAHLAATGQGLLWPALMCRSQGSGFKVPSRVPVASNSCRFGSRSARRRSSARPSKQRMRSGGASSTSGRCSASLMKRHEKLISR